MSDALDKLLKKWSASGAATGQDQQQMALYISREAARRRRYAAVTERSSPAGTLWAWAASAVAVFAIASLVFWSSSPEGVKIAQQDEPEQPLAASRILFDELKAMFSDEFRWMAEYGDQVVLSVGPLVGGLTDGAVPALYQLQVQAKRPGGMDWHAVWNADVLVRTEEWVDVKSTSNGDNQFSFWLYPMSDGNVAVDTRLSLDGVVHVTSQTTALQGNGHTEDILVWRDGDTEYRLQQTVLLLGDVS